MFKESLGVCLSFVTLKDEIISHTQARRAIIVRKKLPDLKKLGFPVKGELALEFNSV